MSKKAILVMSALLTCMIIVGCLLGYKMDEMGILALYTKIGDNQKNSEPVTVGKVKDIMDDAMDHANKGTRRFGRKFSKSATDDDHRILLLEKDFD